MIPSVVIGADGLASLKMSRLGEGTEAPAFSLPTLDGQHIDIQSFAGKVVLVNFWATWCGPCKDEMPALEQLHRQFNGPDFTVVAITTDLQRDGIKLFMHHTGVTFPNLLDESKDVSAAYMIRGLPTSVLVGKDGKVIGRVVGPRQWDGPNAVALIKSLMDKNP